MTDTNHAHPAAEGPVEGDGVHYRGLIWFLAVMAITVLVSNGLMVGTFKFLNHQIEAADPPRSSVAKPAGQQPPAPNLLYQSTGTAETNEPGYLARYRAKEDAELNGYALDKATGVAHIPIDKAKELVLKKGLPPRDVK